MWKSGISSKSRYKRDKHKNCEGTAAFDFERQHGEKEPR
jgi:hypothetical protein